MAFYRYLAIAIPVLAAANVYGNAADPVAIVRKAVEQELAHSSDGREFVWFADNVRKTLDGKGNVNSEKRETKETLFLYGRQFEKLVARDGSPLPADEASKEEARYQKAFQERSRLSAEQRAREDQKQRAQDAKQREFLLQVPDLFTFKMEGVETIRGRPAWVITAIPKRDAKPRGLAASNISKLYAKLWIDQAESRWARVEAEARSPIRFGLFLGSLSEGSRVIFEQAPVNGVWLPMEFQGRLKARLAVKNFNIEETTRFRDYRRFRTDSRIVTQEN
jgi:hypothetical protein